MVSVVKQRRQFQNTQIGINRADMSVANDLGRVSQLADQVTNRMFREAADQAAKSAQKFVDEAPDNAIYGIDPNTGRPKIIDLQESLPSKGYGTYAQDLIKKGIDERFARLATNEYKETSQRLAAKYPFSPTRYKEEMSRFVSEMKKPYSGKYSNLIETGATEWIGRTQAVILEQAIKNQRRLAGADLANSLNEFNQDVEAIGISGGVNSKEFMSNIEKFVGSLSEQIVTSRNLGTFKQTPKQVINSLKSNYALSRMQNIFEKVTRSDTDGLNGALFIDQVGAGRFEFPESFANYKDEAKLLYKQITKTGQGLELKRRLISLQEDNNRVFRAETARKVAEEQDAQNALLTNILQEKDQVITSYDVMGDNNAYTGFVSSIAGQDLETTTSLYLEELQKISNFEEPQSIPGTIGTRSVLNSDEANAIEASLREAYKDQVGTMIVSTFGRDKAKLLAVAEYVDMPVKQDGSRNYQPFIDKGISLSQPEQKLLESFGNFKGDPTEPMEAWGGDKQVKLSSKIRGQIVNEVKEQASYVSGTTVSAAQQKLQAEYNIGRAGSFPVTSKPLREMHEGAFFADGTYGEALRQKGDLRFAFSDPQFMTPEGQYYKFYEDLNTYFVNNNILPESLVQFMKGMENGAVSAQEGQYVLNFIKANVLRPVSAKNMLPENTQEITLPNGRKKTIADSGSLMMNTTKLNLFKRGHGLDEEANFFATFMQGTQAFGSDRMVSLFAKAVEMKNDPSKRDDVMNHLRMKFDLQPNQNPIEHGRRILADVAGGTNNPLYNMLKESVDEWGVLSFTTNPKESFRDFVENVKKTSFASGNDIVLDVNGVIATDNPKDILTPYSPLRLFGDKADAFAEWADTLIHSESNGVFSLFGSNRGSMTTSKGLMSTLFSVAKPMTAESDKGYKVWLVPDPYTSMTVTGEPDLAQTIFRPHFLNDDGELVPAIYFDAEAEVGKQLIYPEILASDFLAYDRAKGMRTYN